MARKRTLTDDPEGGGFERAPAAPSPSAPAIPQVTQKQPNADPTFKADQPLAKGARLSKTWWDSASQEERDAAGVGTWDLAKKQMQDWRARFQPEGDIGQKRNAIGSELATSGASSWDDVAKFLATKGVTNEKEHGKSWWNELKMGWEGTGAGGMHYNPETGQWTDTATSDLAKRFTPGAANFGAAPKSGMAGVIDNAGGGAQEAAKFQQWANSGQTSLEGRTDWGGFYNRRPDGSTDYYDAQGYQTDAQGQRTGGHFLGAGSDLARTQAGAAGAGGGAPVAGGGPTSATPGLQPFNPQQGGGGTGTGGGLEGQVVEGIKKMLSGAGALDPATVEAMKVQAKQRAEGMRQQNSERVASDLARRGLSKSPVGASLQAEASRASDAQYAADATKIEIEATLRAHQERIDALKMAQTQLNDESNRLAQREGMAVEKARLALQQRQLGQERDMLQMQLDARLRELGISNEFQLEMFERRLPLEIFDAYGRGMGGI